MERVNGGCICGGGFHLSKGEKGSLNGVFYDGDS